MLGATTTFGTLPGILAETGPAVCSFQRLADLALQREQVGLTALISGPAMGFGVKFAGRSMIGQYRRSSTKRLTRTQPCRR